MGGRHSFIIVRYTESFRFPKLNGIASISGNYKILRIQYKVMDRLRVGVTDWWVDLRPNPPCLYFLPILRNKTLINSCKNSWGSRRPSPWTMINHSSTALPHTWCVVLLYTDSAKYGNTFLSILWILGHLRLGEIESNWLPFVLVKGGSEFSDTRFERWIYFLIYRRRRRGLPSSVVYGSEFNTHWLHCCGVY